MKTMWWTIGLVLLSGCGAGDSDFNGFFQGTEAGNRAGSEYSANVMVNLSQRGTSISGQWTSSIGLSGTVTGIANGSQVTSLTVTYPAGSQCQGAIVGTATMRNSVIQASLSGLTSCGNLAANLTLNRLQQ